MTGNLSEKSAKGLLMKRVSNAYKLKYLFTPFASSSCGSFLGSAVVCRVKTLPVLEKRKKKKKRRKKKYFSIVNLLSLNDTLEADI